MSNDRAATRCYICGHGNEQALEEHHLVPRRYGGSDSSENLVQLCGSCHNAIESLYDDDFFERLGYLFEERDWSTEDYLAGTRVSVEESIDREVWIDGSVHVFEGEEGRLHCGYCPTVFEDTNHAGLARHLRFKHGVENPYQSPLMFEESETDYSDSLHTR